MTTPPTALPAEWFAREDEHDDLSFYISPRMVAHIDAGAIRAATASFRSLLPPGGAILDLMSSRYSHLPEDVAYTRVAGLGLNTEEMAANPQLSEYVVQSLNADPVLPYADASFDGGVCTVSVQYLTRPAEVFAEVGRVLKPDAPMIVAYSNRMFPTKATAVWRSLDDTQRAGLIASYFRASGVFAPAESHNSGAGKRWGDPLYLVVARRLS